MSGISGDWVICAWCPPDDNEWPESAFTMAGNGVAEAGGRICNDCWSRRYPNRSLPCTRCGSVGRHRAIPVCLECRRAEKIEEMHRTSVSSGDSVA